MFQLIFHSTFPRSEHSYRSFQKFLEEEGKSSRRKYGNALSGQTNAQPYNRDQGGITCGAIDEPRKSSKAINERVIINFRDKNVVIARFRDKNVYR